MGEAPEKRKRELTRTKKRMLNGEKQEKKNLRKGQTNDNEYRGGGGKSCFKNRSQIKGV